MKGDFITMENQEPKNQTNQNAKPINQLSNSELAELLRKTKNRDTALLALREANFRKDKVLQELATTNANLTKTIVDFQKRVAFLEEKTLKKAGRKKKVFYFNEQELTDEYIVFLIDYDYITISKLEKDVNAGKNVLRNRYNKAKKKQQLERQVKRNDNP